MKGQKSLSGKRHKILFICLGNICRSPAANGIMQHLVDERGLTDRYEIDSAGIGSWHIGKLPDHRMREHGRSHGYVFDHHARQITLSDFDRFDYIIVMDEQNYADVVRLRSKSGGKAKVCRMSSFFTSHPQASYVPDPYYGSDSDFELAIELIEDGCAGLLERLEREA